MLKIIISSEVVGKALMYEYLGKKGDRKFVPTYQVYVYDGSHCIFKFTVTRQSAKEVFRQGEALDYGENGECPPADFYLGRITESGRLGFSIMLYENWCPAKESLIGRSHFIRKGVKIHKGPGSSLGCMMVAGGQRGYKRFVKAFTRINEIHGHIFRVVVEDRGLLKTPA